MDCVGEFEYSSKDLIGHGAFAVVFKGRHRKNPNFVVAIKSITKKNLAKSQNLLGKEIKILKELTELHHDNVVALLDCKETSHNVFLVMEYCNGGDLADYLAVMGTLSEDTIRLFLCQLAGAMKALYAKGIVHRDLKPQNILLSHSGGKSCPHPQEIRLKIADFGFARFLQDGVMAATLCGSPMYMAPEVIMSLQYDAKADLWSLGTIVFQCLTGKAPFHAQTPQALKQFYEKNANLAPKIPSGTSPELADLLFGLLRRNACDRIPFDSFFNHPFLQRRPVPTPPRSPPSCPLPGELPPSPGTLFTPVTAAAAITASPVQQRVDRSSPDPGSPLSVRGQGSSSSPEETDDFVLVPSNLPSDQSSDSNPTDRQAVAHRPCLAVASPPRPSFLPISEPIPVPTQRCVYQQLHPNDGLPSPTKSTVPRSQPISMKRGSDHTRTAPPDLSSLSPPSVQFMIGTPPGGGQRRRSASGSSCETPPPVTTWQVSPVSGGKLTPTSSPLRRSGASSPLLSGPLAVLPPILDSPVRMADNNNPHHSPVMPFGTRAMTLPEISGGYQRLFNDAPAPPLDGPITFVAPELPEETLLEREHNETLAKLNFVLALSDCVVELAQARATPLAALTESTAGCQQTEGGRRAERLVLLVRALQLLSSGLNLATQQLRTGQLQPSASVKSVVSVLNAKFRQCLSDCKQLNTPGLLQRAGVDPGSTNITADKILYNHAIQMCQSAALDELFGNPEECFQRYQTAQILLHSLSQQVNYQQDRTLLIKYKDAVEKRLYVLQQQGYIYST
ncbi:serine/threonine-protein kinase unc-51 [Zootermopsis nevadensis]|uniref:Serine/threonine-protein kinase unc-51 n=1 Tax=Zootermopsis nevadensis TaxID=136037 RepID=A0A067QHA8_ZOONE|nr:serine/threonine-protein kinase unc-51 [Zootermopsis nevadensis]KDQ97270.1 Serine/threonine-protein kinase unc-51 [Zootermopsis nevadensis]